MSHRYKRLLHLHHLPCPPEGPTILCLDLFPFTSGLRSSFKNGPGTDITERKDIVTSFRSVKSGYRWYERLGVHSRSLLPLKSYCVGVWVFEREEAGVTANWNDVSKCLRGLNVTESRSAFLGNNRSCKHCDCPHCLVESPGYRLQPMPSNYSQRTLLHIECVPGEMWA